MNRSPVMLAVLTVFAWGMFTSVAAQSRSSKSSVVHRRSHERHTTYKNPVPDDSKKMNTDLAKLETQTSKSKPAGHAAEKKVVVSPKQRDRHNPPLNFSSKGGGGSHSGGTSRAAAARMKTGPRMR